MPGLPCPRPARVVLDGNYARLEPLSPAHAPALFEASSGAGAAARFAFLPAEPPRNVADVESWISRSAASEDPLYFAVVDLATGRAAGREALYLAAHYGFETLGYRRFEWKCNNLNEPSKAAALRFGFAYEGLFRQHMWIKGASRDTAWFAMLDTEWPGFKREYERWLEPSNFDAAGRQLSKLRVRP